MTKVFSDADLKSIEKGGGTVKRRKPVRRKQGPQTAPAPAPVPAPQQVMVTLDGGDVTKAMQTAADGMVEASRAMMNTPKRKRYAVRAKIHRDKGGLLDYVDLIPLEID